jgi:hypothetical protein
MKFPLVCVASLVVVVGCTKNPLGGDGKTQDGFLPGLSSAKPMLSSVSPSAGATTGGTFLTLTGANFVSGATVTIGNDACQNVQWVSSTSLTCRSPAGSGGKVSVKVKNPDTQEAVLADAFEYSSSTAGGTGYAALAGGGISSGVSLRLRGSVGDGGTPFHQTGASARKQSGLQGILEGP